MKTIATRLPVRVFNLIRSKSKLEYDRLIKTARSKTGLSSLGSDFNTEPLEVLCKSINQEARLHPFGQFMMREKLLGQLESRLWAVHWLDRYPEILEQDLLPVIMITGLQRTGTTKMQRLLSQGSNARGLRSWEALYPAPIGKPDESKKRISRTKMNERAVRWLSPEFYHIHPIEYQNFEEDVILLDMHFMSTSSEAIMHVPTYADYIKSSDNTEAYEFEIKLLKLLQWQNPGQYWVLKSPHHLEHLDVVKKLMPGLTLVWMHRDPIKCIPSFMSMLYYSRGMFSDNVNKAELTNHWVPKMQEMLSIGLDAAPEETRHFQFDEFIQNEQGVLEKIQQASPFEMNSRNDAVSHYRSNHQYALEDWGLDEKVMKQDLDFYYTFLNSQFE